MVAGRMLRKRRSPARDAGPRESIEDDIGGTEVPISSNRAHIARIDGGGPGAGAEVEVPEPVPEPPAATEITEEPAVEETATVDPASLGTGSSLPGHGNTPEGGPTPAPAAPTPAATPAGPDAKITMQVSSPKEVKKPEADIAADHGRPGVAGWTSVKYDVSVPSLKADQISVNVKLDFDIELAEEYRAARLAILRDHEYGHVTIGTDAGRTHLGEGLEAGLEALPGFVPTNPVQAAILAAAARFVRDEGAASHAYDTVDYPRMVEAYLGATTPLKDLAAASKEIDNAAKAFTAFAKRGGGVTGTRDLGKLVGDAEKAWSNLGEVDLYRLQYNPNFSDLIEDCSDVVDRLLERFESEELAEPMSGEDVEARRQLDKIRDLLDEFEWEPPF